MRPRDWVIIAVILVGVGSAIVWSTFRVLPRQVALPVPTQSLKLGDCLQDWWGGDVLPPMVKRAPCDGPHFGEVFAVLPVPETQDYPGEEALSRFGDNCRHKLFDYAPELPDGPVFRVAVGYPRADAWANGQRSVVCTAISKGERWSSLRA